MYSIIKSTIEREQYDLSDLLTKINTLWVQSTITDEQRTELVSSAQAHAKAENSYAPVQKQIDTLAAALAALTERVTAIEQGTPHEPPAEPDEWPEWTMWNGVPPIKWQNGSKCTHNGQKYISRVDNNICEPGALGISSTIWEPVET